MFVTTLVTAATTINENINTAGTLTVTGASTLATTTVNGNLIVGDFFVDFVNNLIGIGTSNPVSPLDIYTNSSTTTIATQKFEQDGTGDVFTQYLLTDTTGWAIGIDNSDDNKFKVGYVTSGLPRVDSNTRLAIDLSGNIGVGTDDPNTKLSVVGSADISKRLSVGTDLDDLFGGLGTLTIVNEFAGRYLLQASSTDGRALIVNNHFAETPSKAQTEQGLAVNCNTNNNDLRCYAGSFRSEDKTGITGSHLIGVVAGVTAYNDASVYDGIWGIVSQLVLPEIGETYPGAGVRIEDNGGSEGNIQNGFQTNDGVAVTGLNLGSACYSGSCNSQTIFLDGTEGGVTMYSNQTGSLIIQSNEYVGIGTTTPATKLEVNGIIKTTPRATATCDSNSQGGTYFDSDDNHFYGCNGTTWIQLDN
ncbi:hypothetical protein KJ603_01510 [Patescibacteria group bacterium]|nr:hypothetical protein [Patescibacteria group bacterium]